MSVPPRNLTSILFRQGWICYTGIHVPTFVPKVGLIKPGQTYVCPQVWAFYTKIPLCLFCIFGRPVVSSVLKCRLLQNFWLSLDTCGPFQLAKRDTLTPHNALTFQLHSEDQMLEKNILWLSSLNLTDIAYNVDSHKILKLVFVKYLLSKVDSF